MVLEVMVGKGRIELLHPLIQLVDVVPTLKYGLVLETKIVESPQFVSVQIDFPGAVVAELS